MDDQTPKDTRQFSFSPSRILLCVLVVTSILAMAFNPMLLVILIPILIIIGIVGSVFQMMTMAAFTADVTHTIVRSVKRSKKTKKDIESRAIVADDGSEPTEEEIADFTRMANDFDEFFADYRDLHENDQLDYDDMRDQTLIAIFEEMGHPWPESAALAFKQGRLRVEI